MFSCDDRHPKIQYDEYTCPLCEALEDLEFVKQQGGKFTKDMQLHSLRLRTTEGCC